MNRTLIFLTVAFSISVDAAGTDAQGAGGGTEVAALSVETKEAINANSVPFKKFLTSGKEEELKGLPEQVKKETMEKKQEVEAQVNANDFLNKYFSVGLYANFDVGADRRVQSARLVNGIVRVEESNRAQLGIALQAHRLFASKSGKTAWGPFVAVISNNNGAIASGAIGAVFAIAPKTGFVAQQTSINFGVGVSVNPGSQVLGDGITANEPLPPGETEVRYKKVTLYGVLVTVSFGF